MFFLGHTRFSLFQSNSLAWKASNNSYFKTEEEYKNYLFSDERLNLRIQIFVEESLPILSKAAQGYDVCHVISYCDSLPQKYEQQLIQAAQQYPFIKLQKIIKNKTEFNIFDIPVNYFKKNHTNNKIFGFYRLDDDDLITCNYFKNMAQYIIHQHIGFLVSFGTGLTAIRIGEKYYNIRKSHYPMLAIGLLSVCAIDENDKIIMPQSISHSDSDKANPIILDSREINYFWVRHLTQDTALNTHTLDNTNAINNIKNSMVKYPVVQNFEEIYELFPTLKNKLSRKNSPNENLKYTLFDGIQLMTKTQTFQLKSVIKGQFDIAINYLYSQDKLINNGFLISFSLSELSTGCILDNQSLYADKLKEAGIFLSSNKNVGFYKYLPLYLGDIHTTYSFALPDNIGLNAISIMRWYHKDGDVILKKIEIIE